MQAARISRSRTDDRVSFIDDKRVGSERIPVDGRRQKRVRAGAKVNERAASRTVVCSTSNYEIASADRFLSVVKRRGRDQWVGEGAGVCLRGKIEGRFRVGGTPTTRVTRYRKQLSIEQRP